MSIKKFLTDRKDFILYTVLRVFTVMLSFVANIFIVRGLSIASYGVFSVAFMLVGLLTTFGFGWSSSSIMYFGSKELAKTGSLNKSFWSRNILIAASLAIMTLAFVFLKNQINAYVGMDLAFLILLWLYIEVINDYLQVYFLAVEKQLIAPLILITSKLALVIAVLIFDFDVRALLIIYIISNLFCIFYILGIDKKQVGKFEFDKKLFNEILNFSLWQLFGFSGVYLINFGDTAVIKHFMTLEDVGVYNVAYKLFATVAGLSYVITGYFAASISKNFHNKDKKKIHHLFYKERSLILALIVVLHLIVIAFSKQLLIPIYGQRYAGAVPIFNILMVGSIFMYLIAFYIAYLNASKKHKVIQIVNIGQAVFNVFLSIVLIKPFGLIGPAIATIISIIISALFYVFYCERRIRKLI
jgi:O-antigen/teichoic acid export membrane protein